MNFILSFIPHYYLHFRPSPLQTHQSIKHQSVKGLTLRVLHHDIKKGIQCILKKLQRNNTARHVFKGKLSSDSTQICLVNSSHLKSQPKNGKSNVSLFSKLFLVKLIIYSHSNRKKKKSSQKPHLAHLDKDFNRRHCSNNKNFQTAASPQSPGPCIAENLGVPEHKPHKQLSLMPRKVGAEPWRALRTSLLPPDARFQVGSHMQAWEQTPLLPQPQTCTGRSSLPPAWAPHLCNTEEKQVSARGCQASTGPTASQIPGVLPRASQESMHCPQILISSAGMGL